jgi:hypothetical protein
MDSDWRSGRDDDPVAAGAFGRVKRRVGHWNVTAHKHSKRWYRKRVDARSHELQPRTHTLRRRALGGCRDRRRRRARQANVNSSNDKAIARYENAGGGLLGHHGRPRFRSPHAQPGTPSQAKVCEPAYQSLLAQPG